MLPCTQADCGACRGRCKRVRNLRNCWERLRRENFREQRVQIGILNFRWYFRIKIRNMAEFRILKPSDELLIKVFRKAASLIAADRVPAFVAQLPLRVNWAELHLDENDSLNSELFGASSRLIDEAHIIVKVGGAYGQINEEYCFSFIRDKESPFWDNVKIVGFSPDAIKDDPKGIQLCINYLQEHLIGVAPEAGIAGDLAEERVALLRSLQQINVDLLKGFHEKIQQITKEYSSEKEAFQTDLQKRYELQAKDVVNRASDQIQEFKLQAAEEKAKFEADLQDKVEEIKNREKVLEERSASLDERDNTHVRREIRKDLLREIDARSSGLILSDATKKKQGPIILAMLALSVLLVGLAIWSAIDLTALFHSAFASNAELLFGSIRQISYSGGAVAAIIYLIRWYNRWFTRHAEEEFFIKRFQLDIERASWVVETVLEWEKEKGADKQMPELLLRSLTRNLFQDQAKTVESVVHPADQLASALFGTASKVKLKSGENEVELNARRLSRTKSAVQDEVDN